MGALASADGAGPGAADAAEGAGLIGTTRPR
jgi:hypothetical protein